MRLVLVLLLAAGPLAAQRPGAYLSDLTWPEAERRFRDAPVVVIPFGAGAKEHGPHLPLMADQIEMEYFVKVALDSLPVLVTPPILHGWFPAFREFPGTGIDDPDVFMRYALAVGESVVRHGAKRVVYLNTGIARSTGLPLAIAARELHSRTGVPTLLVSWDDLETPESYALSAQLAGGHADDIETSVILALRPELVHMDRAVTDYGQATGPSFPGYRPGGYSRTPGNPEYSASGIMGDARAATADKGRAVLAIASARWLAALRGFAAVPAPAR